MSAQHQSALNELESSTDILRQKIDLSPYKHKEISFQVHSTPEPLVKIQKEKFLNISYQQIMNNLSNYFEMEKSTKVSDNPRFMGVSKDKLAILEVIGEKTNIVKATMFIGIPNDSPLSVILNLSYLLSFLKNIAPGWIDSDKWMLDSLSKIDKKIDSEKFIKKIDNKNITL